MKYSGNENPILGSAILCSFLCCTQKTYPKCFLPFCVVHRKHPKCFLPTLFSGINKNTAMREWLMSKALRWKFSRFSCKCEALCIAWKWVLVIPFDLSSLSGSWSFPCLSALLYSLAFPMPCLRSNPAVSLSGFAARDLKYWYSAHAEVWQKLNGWEFLCVCAMSISERRE